MYALSPNPLDRESRSPISQDFTLSQERDQNNPNSIRRQDGLGYEPSSPITASKAVAPSLTQLEGRFAHLKILLPMGGTSGFAGKGGSGGHRSPQGVRRADRFPHQKVIIDPGRELQQLVKTTQPDPLHSQQPTRPQPS